MTVYRDNGGRPVREEETAGDLEGYALGKRRAERRLLAADGIDATILRLPGLFGGARLGGFLYNAACAFAAARAPSVPPCPPLWAAMHVDDAAELCIRAATRAPHGSMLLNAGYADTMSLSGALADLARLFATTAPACDAPLFAMDLTRLERELGTLPADSLPRRLRELADLARQCTAGEVSRTAP
jgi:nucleoside-diphosphate-sugar epimerase